MKNIINKLILYKKEFGLWSLVRLLIYPVTLLFWNPIRLAKTLWNAQILANGKWSNYNSFAAHTGLNGLFYWRQQLNFDQYGRNGKSPHVGIGNFKLSNWWHIPLTANYLYRYTGAILPLLGMFGWLGFHTLWLDLPDVAIEWGVLVLFLALISSQFYANAFIIQNYNVVGWLFFPLALWGMINGNYWVATFGWLAVSLGSLTALFIGCILSLLWSIQLFSFFPLLSVFPAVLKYLSHFSYNENLWNTLTLRAKAIGLTADKGVKYLRKNNSKTNISIRFIIKIIIGLLFIIIVYIYNYNFIFMPFSIILLYIINKYMYRFADDQSFYMAMFSISIPIVMTTPSPLILIAYWLVISPLPLFIGAHKGTKYDVPEPHKPFYIKEILDKVNDFIDPVNKNERILLALSNPGGIYSNIFDGYRVLYESVFYIGSMNEVHVFPDWNAIQENNYEGAPEFWGRDPETVLTNVNKWKANTVLIYQNSGTEIDDIWNKFGFKLLSSFDWRDIFIDGKMPSNVTHASATEVPKWFLLKVPNINEKK